MVAKKTVSYPAYTPIGEEISTASTFVQAATALDLAAQLAVESRDGEQLTQIAMVWLEMGTRLSGGSGEDSNGEYEGGDVAGDSEDYPLGFASPAVDAEIRRKRDKNGDKSNS